MSTPAATIAAVNARRCGSVATAIVDEDALVGTVRGLEVGQRIAGPRVSVSTYADNLAVSTYVDMFDMSTNGYTRAPTK